MSEYLCRRCMDDLYETTEVDPDQLKCPSCGNLDSAEAVELAQKQALANLPKYLANSADESIINDVLWAIAFDKRKNLGKGSSSRSKSASKDDKLKSTRLKRPLDDTAVASSSEQISKRANMLTVRKMGHVPSWRLRQALLAYLEHLVQTGRLPADL